MNFLGDTPSKPGREGGDDELDALVLPAHCHPTKGKSDRERLEWCVNCKYCSKNNRDTASNLLSQLENNSKIVIDWEILGRR